MSGELTNVVLNLSDPERVALLIRSAEIPHKMYQWGDSNLMDAVADSILSQIPKRQRRVKS